MRHKMFGGPGGAAAKVAAGLIHKEFAGRPPTIGVIGVSGTGKSSLINVMFKTTLETSHVRACTTEFRANDLEMEIRKGAAEGDRVHLVVIDAPGLGEDVGKDQEYIDAYQRRLPECDIILWLMVARNRAVSLDQQYLREFPDFHERMVFAVNQADLVHPMDWDDEINLPSEEMEANIKEIVSDRAERIGSVIGRAPEIVAVSATRGYNLEELFFKMISTAPRERKFIFDLLKGFSYRDFLPTENMKGELWLRRHATRRSTRRS